MQLLRYQSLNHYHSDYNVNNSILWILLSPIHSSLRYKAHTVTYNYTHFNKSLQYTHINRNYRLHNGFTTKADTSALHSNSQQATANSPQQMQLLHNLQTMLHPKCKHNWPLLQLYTAATTSSLQQHRPNTTTSHLSTAVVLLSCLATMHHHTKILLK